MQPSIPPIGRRLSFSMSQVDLTHSDDYHCPMGGIDGCILLGNELLAILLGTGC